MSPRRDNDDEAAAGAAGSGPPAGDAPTDTEASEPVLERDDLYHVLQNERRRRTLRYLLAGDEEPVTIGTLAEVVAAAECDTTVDELRYDERQRVYTTLYQSHLPQLADAGLIAFDPDRGLITTTPHTEAVIPYLDYDGDTERDITRWLGAVLAGTGLGMVFMLVVAGLGPVPTVGLTVLVALVALGVATWRSGVDIGNSLRPPARR